MNEYDSNGKSVLDYAIPFNSVELIEPILSASEFCFKVTDINLIKFIDVVNRSGNLRLLRGAIDRGIEENQVRMLLEYISGILADYLKRIFCVNPSNKLAYCTWARNCSNSMSILWDWMITQENTKLERELIEAIINTDEERIFELLKMNININYQDRKGNTPLMCAIMMCDPELVAAILGRKPNLLLKNNEMKMALDMADESPNESIRTLIRNAMGF